jgi:hypothetical protein
MTLDTDMKKSLIILFSLTLIPFFVLFYTKSEMAIESQTDKISYNTGDEITFSK